MISIIFSTGLVVKVNATKYENGNLTDIVSKSVGVVPTGADCIIMDTAQIIEVIKPETKIRTVKQRKEGAK